MGALLRTTPILCCAALLACASTNTNKTPPTTSHLQPLLASMQARGAYQPLPLDGAKIAARNVDLLLPRGCVPLDAVGMASASRFVDDGDSELLAACNVVEHSKNGNDVRVTLVLIRHDVLVETGDSAAKALMRSPGVLSATTTTAGPLLGQTLGPEVVLTLNAPSTIDGRPSAAIWFGALDGLYVLYGEVDGDMESLAQWGDSLTSSLHPTSSAHPIRWRAPSGLAPSQMVIGPYGMKLPEEVSVVRSSTFNDLIGDAKDPLDLKSARSFGAIRDAAGIALSGIFYRRSLLAPIADTPEKLVKMIAAVDGASDVQPAKTIDAKIGRIARLDAIGPEGRHEIYAAFLAEKGEAVVVHLAIAADKWDAYAPFVDASLSSIDHAAPSGPY